MKTVILNIKLLAQIQRHAEVEYPHECCGFILGKEDDNHLLAEEYLSAINRHEENRERRFLIDPLAWQRAEDYADDQGLQLISIVHSHPDHSDQPSEFDRIHAWPGISYMILSICQGVINSQSVWWLRDDRTRFDAIDLEVGR